MAADGFGRSSPKWNATMSDPGVVVITGASSGIEQSKAIRFAREGWRVGLIARGADTLDWARRDVIWAFSTACVAVADAILFAATHRLREVKVGEATVAFVIGNKFVPEHVDWIAGKTGVGLQRSSAKPDSPIALGDPSLRHRWR